MPISLSFASLMSAFRTITLPNSAPRYEENTNADLICDRRGVLWTRNVPLFPNAGLPGSAWSYQSVPADDTAIVLGASTILTQTGGFNDSAGSIYVQLHNKAVALVLGDVPTMTFLVPSNASFSWTPSNGGRQFSTGITFGVSSTRDTYTALVTPIFLFAEGIIL